LGPVQWRGRNGHQGQNQNGKRIPAKNRDESVHWDHDDLFALQHTGLPEAGDSRDRRRFYRLDVKQAATMAGA
jgi:hypothetical protein